MPGECAVAEKDLTGQRGRLPRSFPGHPVFPGVLQLEALAQTGAVAVLSQPESQGKIVLFGGVEKVRFRRQVVPGDTLRLEVELLQARPPWARAKARPSSAPSSPAAPRLTFAVVDRA